MPPIDRLRRTLHEEYVAEVLDALVPPDGDGVSRTLRPTRTDVSNEGTPPLHVFEYFAFQFLNFQRTSGSPMVIRADLVKALKSLFEAEGNETVSQLEDLFPGLSRIFEALLAEHLIDKPIDELEHSIFEDLGRYLGIVKIEANFNQRHIAPRLREMVRSRLFVLHEIEKSKRTEADVVVCVLHIVLDFYQAVHAQDIDELQDDPLQPIHSGPVDWAIAGQSAWRVAVFGASTYALATAAYGWSRFYTFQNLVPDDDRVVHVLGFHTHAAYIHSVSTFAAVAASTLIFGSAWKWKAKLERPPFVQDLPWKSKFAEFKRVHGLWGLFLLLMCGALDVGAKAGAIGYHLSESSYMRSSVDDFYEGVSERKDFLEEEIDDYYRRCSMWKETWVVAVNKLLIDEAQKESKLGVQWMAHASVYFPNTSFLLLEGEGDIADILFREEENVVFVDEWTIYNFSMASSSWLVAGPVKDENGHVQTVGWIILPDDIGLSGGESINDLSWDKMRVRELDEKGAHGAVLDDFLLSMFRDGCQLEGTALPDAMYDLCRGESKEFIDVSENLRRRLTDIAEGGYPSDMDSFFSMDSIVDDAFVEWCDTSQKLFRGNSDKFREQVDGLLENYTRFDKLLGDDDVLDSASPPVYRLGSGDCGVSWSMDSPMEFLRGYAYSVGFDVFLKGGLGILFLAMLVHLDVLLIHKLYRKHREDELDVEDGLRHLQAKLEQFIQIIHAHSNVGPMVDLYNPWKKTEEGEVESVEEPPFSFEALRSFIRSFLLRTSVPYSQRARDVLDVALGRLSPSAVAYNRLVYLAQEVLFKDAALLENELMGDPKREHEHPRRVIDEVCRDDTRNHQVLRRRFHAALRNNVKKIEKRR